MKDIQFPIIVKILFTGIICLLYNHSFAQGTAQWAGDTGTGATTWANTGNIVGSGIFYSVNNTDVAATGTYLKPTGTWTNNVANDPDMGKIYPRIGFQGTYPGQTDAGWPAKTIVEIPDIFIQYAITPSGTEDVHIQKISYSVLGLGTGTMRANGYVSTDPTFTTKTQVVSNLVISPTAFNDEVINGLDILVKPNQKLYFRLYPWFGNSTAASTSKYIVVKNVKFETFKPVDITDATLKDIFTNALRISGFTPSTTNYNIELLFGTTKPPFVTASQTEPGATVVITDAATVPGTATITVTGVDKVTTKTYTINFTQAATVPQIAFPGAEGYGKYASGGRGGVVYEVTNLNDSGPGSLRAGVEASGARTIVFKVSGTIILNSNLNVSNPNLTIAGQTAPGDGICIRKYPLVLDGAKNVIIRYIRVRLGNESGGESDAVSGRAASNIILDHVSASWSVDETLSLYNCNNITVQWSVIAESLFNSNHPKGYHGFGGIAGSDNSTYHHNLVADHSSRNLRMASGAGYFDYRNNVIYNWGYNSCYGGEYMGDPTHTYTILNMVANYYKPGPATQSGSNSYRIANPGFRNDVTDYGKWYIANNFMFGNSAVTADNWSSGVQPDGGSGDIQYLRLATPWQAMPIKQQLATDAFSSVLDNGGATLPKRDAVDVHIINDARTGEATYEGPTYKTVKTVPNASKKTGIIDLPSDVGGWPVLNSITAPVDTDKDGMPDDWETANGLNPNNASDRNTVGADGYTNLEKYLNSIEFNYPVEGYKLTKITDTSYKLEWVDNYLAEEGFVVERSVNNGPYEALATLPQYSNNYTDNSAVAGLLTYRVIAFNKDNTTPKTTNISNLLTAVNDKDLPAATLSVKCFPNPFAEDVNLELSLPESQKLLIEIFELNGKKIAVIANRNFRSGNTSLVWNSSDFSLKPGMYILSIKNENSILKKQIKIIKN